MANLSLCSPKPSNFYFSKSTKSFPSYYLPNQNSKLLFSSPVMHRMIIIKPAQLSGSGSDPNRGDHKVVISDGTNQDIPKLQPCNTKKRKRVTWRSMILLAVPLYERLTSTDDVTKTLGTALEAIETMARMVEQLSLEMEKLPIASLKCEALHVRHISQEIITFVVLAENFIRKVDEILMVWNKT